MTLEDLGNVGEFIGAVGVVISFVFLAIQIRHNTNAIRYAAEKDLAQNTADFLAPIVESAEVAQIYRVGLRDWDALDANDRMRFSMHLFLAFYFFQNLYSRYRQHQIETEYWASQREVIMWYMRQAGIQRWWHNARSRLNLSFVQFIESECSWLPDGKS